MSRVVCRGSCGLRSSSGCPSVDRWGCAYALFVAWPEASQYWSLQAVEWGPVLVLMTQARCLPPRGFMCLNSTQNFHHQCPRFQGEPQPHLTSSQTPPRPVGSFGLGSCEDTAFDLGSGTCETLCVSSKSEVSVFPSPVSSCNQALLAFKTKCFGSSSPWCQILRLGSLMWGSELSCLWENFCSIIILQFVDGPPVGCGIWLYCECTPPTVLPWFLLYILGYRISFFAGSSLFY